MNKYQKTAIYIAVASLIGCGGGTTTADNGRIDYVGTSVAGKGTINDYMNATWLYDNYFGEMGLPVQIKPKLMIEMQRLANGFTLQYKLGEDVKANMEHFHTTMNSAMGRTMMANFAQKMSDVSETTSLNAGTSPSAEILALLPPPTQEQIDSAKAGEASDAVASANLKAVFQSLEIPYDLSDNATPWISWSADFMAQKGKGRGNASQPAPLPTVVVDRHNAKNWPYTTGDVMYVEWNEKDNKNEDGIVNNNVNVWPLGHIGLIEKYNPTERTYSIIDSKPGNPGSKITRWANIADWASSYKLIQAHSPRLESTNETIQECNPFSSLNAPQCVQFSRRTPTSQVRDNAVQFASDRVGQFAYAAFVGKNSDSSTYCSALIWKAYKEGSRMVRDNAVVIARGDQGRLNYLSQLDLDLDSDGGYWVMPRDILRSAWMNPAYKISDTRGMDNFPMSIKNPNSAIGYVTSSSFRYPVR